jgi:exosortase H (IPTLxxWG-CTERM-specific)
MGKRSKGFSHKVSCPELSVASSARALPNHGPQVLAPSCLGFLALCGASFLLAALAAPPWLDPLNGWTARLTADLLGIFGLEARARGASVSLHGFHVGIILECTPLFPLLLLVSFVLAHPASPRERLTGLFVGGGILVLANGLRVAALVLIGWKKPAIFHGTHVYLGQVGTVLCVVGICAAWIRFGIGASLQETRLGFFLRFAAISGVLFVVWAEVNRGYIGLGDVLIREAFSWWGYRLTMPRGHVLYYHSFSVVAFAGLLLAARPMRLAERIRALALGIGVLVSLHLVVRMCNVLTTGLKVESAGMLSVAAGTAAQYLVPFLLWVWIVGRRSNRSKALA